jgi:hypothetical protein
MDSDQQHLQPMNVGVVAFSFDPRMTQAEGLDVITHWARQWNALWIRTIFWSREGLKLLAEVYFTDYMEEIDG